MNTSTKFPQLLSQFKLGSLTLNNRIVMAPLYRGRSDPKTGVPSDLAIEYYRQRATAGLIITDCTTVSRRGAAYLGVSGIYSDQQVQQWKRITQAVHEQGGKIFLQIWHGGRVAHPDNIDGETPLAPSPIASRTESMTPSGMQPLVTPKEMTEEEIQEVIQQFRKGAENAKEAGFDGLEVHSANGYLIDEFLRDWSNQRQDKWGGSPENRVRFCLEVLDQCISVFGSDRVGIKLTPVGRFRDMFDSDPKATYTVLIQELNKRNIAYIHTIQVSETDLENKNIPGLTNKEDQMKDVIGFVRPLFNNAIIGNVEYTPEKAEEDIANNRVDLVAFGRAYIPNPDLVSRIANDYPLATSTPEHWFGGDAKGYTDYPTYEESTK